MRSLITLALIIALSLLAPSPGAAEEAREGESPSTAPLIPPVVELPPPAPPPSGLPPLKRVAPGLFELGPVQISKREGRVVFPAVVNMERGPLEYVIVGSGGKVHESLLRTDVSPYLLHIAMLLAGFEGTLHPLAFQGAPQTPEGDPVHIRVEWQEGTTVKQARVEEWIVRNGTPLKPMEWTFTGSVVHEGALMAQVEQSIVAIFHDPFALIDHPLPEGASDELWFVREGAVPPVGTHVTVTVQRAAARGAYLEDRLEREKRS